jgi:hypothetical protein
VVKSIRKVRPASRPYDLRFMPWIVGLLVVVPLALNGASTAHAATARPAGRCVVAGTHAGGARGFVVARPHHSVLEHVPVATAPCGTTFWVDPRGGPLHALTVTGPGWAGTIRSGETRVDGLVGSAELRSGHLRGGGHANLAQLKSRLDRTRSSVLRTRILLAAILIGLALFAPRRAVVGGAAAVTAALVLSAFGSTSLTLFAILTLVGSLAPWRALWLFFAVYLVVLVVSPETQSLALLGPHPWGAGRFYGVSNELETLLLAPALALGVLAAPLTLLTLGWSRAGADGGGVLVLLSSYTVLLLGVSPRRLVAAGTVAVFAGLAFVVLDAATGGSSHVTNAVLHGGLAHDIWHRWLVSWHGATGTWGRTVVCALCIVALAWVATRRPRSRIVDAFLVGIVVSIVANDTPQDVLFWGAISGVGLRRAV